MIHPRTAAVLFAIGVTVLVFIGAAPNGCGPGQTTAGLKVGYSRLRISLPVFVAQEQGYFAEQGLDVELQVYDTAQPLMQALVEGKVDVAGYTALPITYNGMLRSGKQLYFLTTMIEDQEHRISYLLRRKSDPPSDIRTIADLRGKTIGILPTIAYRSWLNVILRENGLDPEKDVTIQQIAPAQQPLVIKSGGVDALFTNDPGATAAIVSGVAELISAEVECPKYIQDPFPFGSFNVSKEWADGNPETYRKLRAAMDAAVDFVNAHPAEANRMMAAYLPAAFRPHVERYPDAKYLNSSQTSEELFKQVAASYLEMGIIGQELDLTGLVAK